MLTNKNLTGIKMLNRFKDQMYLKIYVHMTCLLKGHILEATEGKTRGSFSTKP